MAAAASSPLPVPYAVKRVSIGQRSGQRARARGRSQSQCGSQENGGKGLRSCRRGSVSLRRSRGRSGGREKARGGASTDWVAPARPQRTARRRKGSNVSEQLAGSSQNDRPVSPSRPPLRLATKHILTGPDLPPLADSKRVKSLQPIKCGGTRSANPRLSCCLPGNRKEINSRRARPLPLGRFQNNLSANRSHCYISSQPLLERSKKS